MPENYFREASIHHLNNTGLLTSVQFWAHDGKLGAIGLSFNNGHEDLSSPIFGEKSKIDSVLEIDQPVNRVQVAYAKYVTSIDFNGKGVTAENQVYRKLGEDVVKSSSFRQG